MKILKKPAILGYLALFPLIFGTTNLHQVSAEELFDYGEILTPIWEGDTCYQESVLVVEEQDGSIAPISLLYPATEIISVKSATLETTYIKDTDYSLSNGKLVVNKDGSIPHLTYQRMHPTSIEELEYQTPVDVYESASGGYINLIEGMWYHERQIVVTYKHSETYQGYIPESKGNLLPKTQEILKNHGELNVFVFGDSISTGSNSSGKYSTSPYMPIYPLLVKRGLEDTYGVTVNMVNESVGGKDSKWGMNTIGSLLPKYQGTHFDLAIIAFGMNDGYSAKETASNEKAIMDKISEKDLNCEFVLVGTMLPNPDCIRARQHQGEQVEALLPYECNGCVVGNMTDVHRYLLSKKRFADMTGNDINHCNDYLARVYAMTLLKTIHQDETPYVPKPHTKRNVGLIIGISVGGSAVVLGAGILIAYGIKKRKKPH